MKETWEYYSVPQDEDVMKSMLGERIKYLEGLLSKKAAEIERLEEGFKLSKYGFIRENAELKDELAKKDKAYQKFLANF